MNYRMVLVRIQEALRDPAAIDPRTTIEKVDRLCEDALNDPIEASIRYATTHVRREGGPPSYVRCPAIRVVSGKDFRCIKVEGHTDEHESDAKDLPVG